MRISTKIPNLSLSQLETLTHNINEVKFGLKKKDKVESNWANQTTEFETRENSVSIDNSLVGISIR